jgi:PmbA protein
MPDILELAQLAVSAAMKAGAEWADAYCGVVRHADVGVDNSSILDCHVVRDYGLGIRAFYKGGMGAATIQSLKPEDVARCGEEAARIAKVAHPDPDFVGLPEPSAAPEIEGLFDDRIAGLPAETVVQWCREAIEEAKAVDGDARVSGGAGFSVGEGALASSTGIALTRGGTKIELSIEAIIQREDEVGFYFDYDVARRLADFQPVGVGAKATREALRFLGAKPVSTGRMSLVLGPMAVGELLGAVIGAASAENIQRCRSFLIDREGTKIASDCLTVKEVPFWPAGISSSSHDGEGVAKSDLALLEAGVLTTFLHNSYTANKAGVPNNAHATRGGYGGGVGIGVSNLQVTPGARTEQELIAEISDGLYINYAGLAPDPASGEVSATIDFGFKIIDGQLAYPVKTAMVGSDAFEMLAALDAVSSDYREEPGTIVPSLRLRDIQVAGGG